MKKLFCYATVLFALIFFTGCNDSVTEQALKEDSITVEKSLAAPAAAPLTDHHNAVSSLDWDGSYKGTLPCADCEGIATEITLGKDLSYSIKTTYIGKAAKPTEEKGNFGWDGAGNTITLKGIANRPNQYFVGENYLAQMDMGGKRITGDLAEKYILAKQQSVASAMADSSRKNAPLAETKWTLVSLNGQAIEMPAEGKREVYLTLKKKDNRVQGFSGCNSMMGAYELKEGNLIHFKNLASSRMACPDMKTENDFKKMLEQVDNYTIEGDQLSLNKAKMAPLATFKGAF
jgi:heat shock protein HslJ